MREAVATLLTATELLRSMPPYLASSTQAGGSSHLHSLAKGLEGGIVRHSQDLAAGAARATRKLPQQLCHSRLVGLIQRSVHLVWGMAEWDSLKVSVGGSPFSGQGLIELGRKRQTACSRSH